MDQIFVLAVVCIGALAGAQCLAEEGPTTPTSVLATPASASLASSPTQATPPTAVAAPPPTPARPTPPTLAGVRPMKDRSNSSEPIPCTCGIFLTSQFKGQGQPVGLPAMSHEFKRATANTAYGVRQCTSACVDMIVKHLPNSGPILCSSIDRTVVREKAYLFIKNHRNKWLATRLSAGKEFCCKNGAAVRCPPK